MTDVLCIGNAKMDSFLSIHDASKHCRLDSHTGELCVKAGEKIPLETTQFELGGNACNVAVGLSRLGLKSSLVAEVGSDDFAHTILSRLEKEGVDLSHLKHTKGQTGFSVAITFKNDRTLFSQHMLHEHNFSFGMEAPNWIYLTSLGKEWHHVYEKVEKFVTKHKISLVFNPGTPQLDEGLAAIKEILKVTKIFILNKDEAIGLLYGRKYNSEDYKGKEKIREIMQRFQELGPSIVVLTDGSHGSYAWDQAGVFYYQRILSGEVVEKTGAGDGFSTGFTAATVHKYDIKTAMIWGSLNAAGVIEKVGAQPGLLTREGLEGRMGKLRTEN